MSTSSNGNIFRVTGPFCVCVCVCVCGGGGGGGGGGGPLATGGFPSQRPVTRSFDVLRLNKSEQTVEQIIETSVILDVVALIMTLL